MLVTKGPVYTATTQQIIQDGIQVTNAEVMNRKRRQHASMKTLTGPNHNLLRFAGLVHHIYDRRKLIDRLLRNSVRNICPSHPTITQTDNLSDNELSPYLHGQYGLAPLMPASPTAF